MDILNKNSMTPRKRVELALQKKFIDKVPFTVYGSYLGFADAEKPVLPFGKFFPQCGIERLLRNMGLCIVDLTYYGYSFTRPNVKVVSTVYEEKDQLIIRTDYETPLGSLYSIKEVKEFTIWVRERLFKSIEDYKALLFLFKDIQIFPNYEPINKALRILGEDVILKGNIGYEPIQELIATEIMGAEKFCTEWMDNRDEILKIYNAIIKNRRKIYKIVANSPIYFVCYGGNVIPEIIGPKIFEKYYVPHYEEAAEELHKKGKVLACHYDGNTRLLKDIIAETSLDIIEAFTPHPDTDMTMKEAREAWPDKVLWINFPSSLHLSTQKKIADTTSQIIDDAGPEGLIIGITEDVPEDRWQKNYYTIMDTIDKKFGISY